jgi:hypothetical protein
MLMQRRLLPAVPREVEPQAQIQMVTHAFMEVQMVKRVAMIFGVVSLIIGVLGFTVPGGMQMGDAANAPQLLGLFPMNLLHSLLHLLIGIWGILAARSFSAAQAYCKLGGMIYLALALLGFVTPTLFGLVPIGGGNNILLHTILGVLLVWVGFASKQESAAAAAA